MLSAFRENGRPGTEEDPAVRLGLLVFQGNLEMRIPHGNWTAAIQMRIVPLHGHGCVRLGDLLRIEKLRRRHHEYGGPPDLDALLDMAPLRIARDRKQPADHRSVSAEQVVLVGDQFKPVRIESPLVHVQQERSANRIPDPV